jgi:hypothetical protein
MFKHEYASVVWNMSTDDKKLECMHQNFPALCILPQFWCKHAYAVHQMEVHILRQGYHPVIIIIIIICNNNNNYYYYIIYGITAFLLNFGRFFFRSYSQSVELLGWWTSLTQGIYLHTGYTHTNIISTIELTSPSFEQAKTVHAATVMNMTIPHSNLPRDQIPLFSYEILWSGAPVRFIRDVLMYNVCFCSKNYPYSRLSWVPHVIRGVPHCFIAY